jgi:hypothetical protein
MTAKVLKKDSRCLSSGLEIPVENYCDQPYVIRTRDGAWLCTVTTGPGKEGQAGQHVVAMRSRDQGRTWTDRVDVESARGPESSYSVLLQTPGGRIYCFYNHNTDNLRRVKGDPKVCKGGWEKRVDSLGYFVFKYSDDGGRSWSKRRYNVPVREFAIDRENVYGGKIRFGWNVGRPFVLAGAAYVSFHKVGGFGEGFFNRSEGVLLRSDNILTEPNPKKIRWATLPDGDVGLRAPAGGGPIAEEQSYVTLKDGGIYCMYRTIAGHPCCSISRDGGHTWSRPQFARYADGRPIRHPRAANFVWKCRNGKFLYWFHNNGWTGYNFGPGSGSRNVAWLCGGVERDGGIAWSQPDVVLYGEDFFQGPSYPDLIEEGGRYFLTETQKTVARVHEVDREMLEGLWEEVTRRNRHEVKEGLALDLSKKRFLPKAAPMPVLPEFVTRDYWAKGPGRVDLGGGFTLEFGLQLRTLKEGQVLLDSRTESGAGLAIITTARGTIELAMNDGRSESRWDCDPGAIVAGKKHRVAVIVDGWPRLIAFVIDGRLCDGGGRRMYGWGRFSPVLRHANGGKMLRIARGAVQGLRIYERALRVGEVAGHVNM